MQLKLLYLFLLFVYQIRTSCACQNHKTCHECITDPKVCVWCASTNETYDSEARCRTQAQVDAKWCVGSLDTPDAANVTADIKYNRNFSSDERDLVQVKPQLYNVKLRVGQPVNFTFSYQEAKDYPVDLYMLLDASNTMSIIKEELARSSETIYKTMQRMTKNVHMGFGTFVDKNTQPFTLDVAKKTAYSFRNHLNLTEDFAKFQSTVENTAFGSNHDIPEGGFDALAQVIACNGFTWRTKSRRIVVFLTDATQHTVGDGRSGGIFKPFDGNCHTNEFGMYTKELEMDYPSIPMINALASDNDVIVIFAIHEKKPIKEYYEAVKKAIRGSKLTMIDNATLLVNKLEESYKEISTRIKFDLSNNNNFDIKFDPDCYTNSDDNACKVIPDQQINFTGTVTLTKYTGNDLPSIGISVQGTKDKLSLEVDVIKCSCENDIKDSDPYCNGQKRECGVCVCDNNKRGTRCMCDANAPTDTDADESSCKTDKGTCNSLGKCECGTCKCAGSYGTYCNPSEIKLNVTTPTPGSFSVQNQKIIKIPMPTIEVETGVLTKNIHTANIEPPPCLNFHRFCECNLQLCPGYNDTDEVSVCNNHGKCHCIVEDGRGKETCSCDEDWTHGEKDSSCSCQLSNDLCIAGGTVCNNRGICTCNACVCEPIAAWDKRPLQDQYCRMKPCPDCHAAQCTNLLKCVQCTLDSSCGSECNGILVEISETLPEELMNTSTDWMICENQKVNIGCYTNYVYQYDDVNHTILLRVQKKTDCAESFYTYGGILLATLLLAGILTLLAWKCLTRYQDRKEFEKFEKQYKEDLYNVCQNPIYNQPTTTFRNPAFEKN